MGFRPDLLRMQIYDQLLSELPPMPEAQGTNPLMSAMAQGEQEIQESQERNPIADGASIGLDAARRSLEMSPRQERRALGRAIMQFASSFSRQPMEPGSGFAGALGAMNASLGPAVEAYDKERGNSENHNLAILRLIDEQNRQRQAQSFRREQLDEQRRYHDMMAPLQEAHADYYRANTEKVGKQALAREKALVKKEELLAKGIMPEGSVMFDEISDNKFRESRQKHVEKLAERYIPNVENIEQLDLLQEVRENNPELWRSAGRLMEASINKDPTALKTLLAKLASEGIDIRDSDIIEKAVNTIVKNEIAIAGGKITNMHKQILVNSLIKATTHPDAAKVILDAKRRDYLLGAKNAKQAMIGLENGFIPPMDTSSLDEMMEKYYMQGEKTPNKLYKEKEASQEISQQYTPEQIQAAIARKRAQLGANQ